MKLVKADVAAPVIGCRESWLRWAAQHGLGAPLQNFEKPQVLNRGTGGLVSAAARARR